VNLGPQSDPSGYTEKPKLFVARRGNQLDYSSVRHKANFRPRQNLQTLSVSACHGG